VLLEKKIKPKPKLGEWLFRAMPKPNGNQQFGPTKQQQQTRSKRRP
jgi:hypothetical protein